MADTIKRYIAMKKERVTCRTLRPWKNARNCLKRTAKFDWLDRYKLTEADGKRKKKSGGY